MTSPKIVCGIVCFLVLASNIWSMLHWNEARGVYDDVCYLRQAHLFQRFGVAGFDTDISRDDDHYFQSKLKEIGFPTWNDIKTIPCHTPIPSSGKRVLQYPPGTGMVLALFPEGYQVVPLYILATVVVFGFALLGIWSAPSPAATWATGGFGCLALYLMINPTKASYSMAPTMIVCALAGWLTARWLMMAKDSRALPMLIGLVLGVAVNFRLPNLFLSSGYLLFFVVSVLAARTAAAFAQASLFGIALLAGMMPTLLANAINAGSPVATTYGGADVAAPAFSISILWQYVSDMQFVLLALAIAGVAILLRRHDEGNRQVALVAGSNLAINLVFFLSHPVFTPYYTVPIAMLSLWSTLFAWLTRPARPARDTSRRPAVAASGQREMVRL